MRLVVIYDISDDALRGKVSECLKDYGLERIQFSSFQGELQRHSFASMETDLRKLLHDGDESDSILIFPLCSSCFNGRHELGCAKEMERGEVEISFF